MLKHLRKEVPKKTNVWSEIWNRKSGMKKTKGGGEKPNFKWSAVTRFSPKDFGHYWTAKDDCPHGDRDVRGSSGTQDIGN